uniref:Terminase small subunit n=1 Tax=Xanthomonas phage MK21 TaxID=3148942 RepID=A0AAU7J8F5_9CAUD
MLNNDIPRPGRGGKRPGAGRPKGSVQGKHTVVEADLAMLELLRQVALGRIQIDAVQLKAAIAAVGYESSKQGDIGKKQLAQDVAEEISAAFPVTPPPMRIVK